ncbi:hypothetical protein K8R43_02870 [archaeon]|nr:hypothetical protein [archaeon]
MKENVIGVIKGAQGKSKTSVTVKTCDLYFTTNRIICSVVGGSTLTSAMVGGAVGGVSAQLAYYAETMLSIEDKRAQNMGKEMGQLLEENKENYSIPIDQIDGEKSTYKTGFFSTLGMWAPLSINTLDGKKYFFNTVAKESGIAKKIIASTTSKIRIV